MGAPAPSRSRSKLNTKLKVLVTALQAGVWVGGKEKDVGGGAAGEGQEKKGGQVENKRRVRYSVQPSG